MLDSRLASVQIALAPTQAEQGALEVLPASHTHDERPAAAGAPDPQGVSIAVPAGTVVFYSPNLVHRGRANWLSEERLAVTINVMGALTKGVDSLPPYANPPPPPPPLYPPPAPRPHPPPASHPAHTLSLIFTQP